MFFSLTKTYVQTSEDVMIQYLRLYDANEQGPEGGGAPKLDFPRTNNPSMSAVAYYVKIDTGEIDKNYYRIIGAEQKELHESIDEDFKIETEDDDFILTQLNGYYYLSLNSKVDNPKYERDGYQMYLKIYNNVDGEMKSRNYFMTIYATVASIIFLFSFLVGIIMMREFSKPLRMFIKKQTNFVSDASHELRTPLAVVQSKIETLLSQPDKTVYEVSEDLAISLSEINRLTKLTQELLTLARNDKDNINVNYSIFDLDELMRSVVEPFIEIAEINGKKMTYVGESCMVRLDKDMVKQVAIINIDNALKYTEAGDEITVKVINENNEAVIEIGDTGIGLSDESKKKVFDRFYREDKARSREKGGNGLGLSIANTLVNLQKGSITVSDNAPKGTIFTIIFPKPKEKQLLNEENRK